MSALTVLAGFAMSLPALTADELFDLYPQQALQAGQSAGIYAEVVIDPDGKAKSCKPLSAVGNAALIARICPIVLRHGFAHPTGANGERRFGLWRTEIKFFMPDTREGRVVSSTGFAPEYQVSVRALPGGITNAVVGLMVEVDERGAIADCAPAANVTLPQVASALCSNKAMFQEHPLLDATGHPVRYITNFRVAVTTAPPAP